MASFAMKRNPPVPRFGVSSSSGEDSWIECVWADSASSVKIFRFKILELLGEGGFCQCYKVLESETGRIFALKVFLKDKLVGDMKAKFLSEIKIHKSMIHPHIVRFEAVLKDSACYYVLMEMCHYSSMDALIKRRKRLREPECQYYLLQVLSALRYMHSHLVIHRDIKLANLFLQNGLMVKIGDFGLSTRLTHALERKLSFCGTPNYLAPEIFDRKEGHSFEVDIWALGCILYTMLFGRPPFASNSIDSVYRKIHSSDVIFPEESQVSDVAKDLILKILQNNPLKRLSIDGILDHPFFKCSSVPKSLPIQALQHTPLIAKVQSRIHGSSMDLHRGPNTISSPSKSSEYEMQIDSVSELRSEYKSDPLRHVFYVAKFMDYSDKYGICYLLSNGDIGLLFNDYTTIVTHEMNCSVRYISGSGKITVVSMNMLVNLSRELTKKTQIYQYLSARLKLLNPQIEILPISTYHVKKSGEVYVTQIKVTDIAVSFKFNDGLIQSRFNDCTNLLLKPTGETVYIDEEQNIFSFEIQNLPVEAQSLKLRVEYLKNIVGKFNEGEGKR